MITAFTDASSLTLAFIARSRSVKSDEFARGLSSWPAGAPTASSRLSLSTATALFRTSPRPIKLTSPLRTTRAISSSRAVTRSFRAATSLRSASTSTPRAASSSRNSSTSFRMACTSSAPGPAGPGGPAGPAGPAGPGTPPGRPAAILSSIAGIAFANASANSYRLIARLPPYVPSG